MTDLAARNALLAVIRAGDFSAILPLSDVLCEEGREREAVLLRGRYQRWQRVTERIKNQSALEKTVDKLNSLVPKGIIQGMGEAFFAGQPIGQIMEAAVTLLSPAFKAKPRKSQEHENRLLLAYVERLFSPAKPRTIRKGSLS